MNQPKEEQIKAALSLARSERHQRANAIIEVDQMERPCILANQRRYQELLLSPLLEIDAAATWNSTRFASKTMRKFANFC